VDAFNPVLFLLLFLVFWFVVVLALSRIGGWATLAESYPATEEFIGERWRFRSGRLNRVSYNNCLTVASNAHGLYLSILFPFRPGHAPLFIPWSDVASSPPTRRWFMSVVEFRFSRAPSIRLDVPANLAENLAGGSGGRFTLSAAT
jgi:hypothetical protein